MFTEEMSALCHSAKKKLSVFNDSKARYIMMAALGGMFVGLGVMLLYTVGGILDHGNVAGTKIIMGVSFGVALSLVIMVGVDLFTSNSLIMTIGAVYKKVTFMDMIKILLASYVGNIIGSVIAAVLYVKANAATPYVAEYILKSAELKMNTPAMDLFFKGILCNILVCLSAWFSYKMKSESGKLIMIFWCLYTFITAGFEHSVANMTLFSMSLLMEAGTHAVSLLGACHNLLWVSLGNFVGGTVFMALPLYFIAKEKSSKKITN